MDEAERCHRVAFLHEGEIIVLGSPEELKARSRQRWVEIWARPEEAVEGIVRQEGWPMKRLKDRFLAQIPSGQDVESVSDLMQRQGITLTRLQERAPDLEEVFLSLLEQRNGIAGDLSGREEGSFPALQPDGPAIKIRGLVKRFGDFTAVAGIDFQVGRGEIFGFLGPNGAGKTTTIKILCGIIPPTEGGGEISGFDILRERHQIKSRIGYMSQKFSLYRDLSVSENLRLYGGIYQVDRQAFRSRQAWVMELADLQGRENTLARDLPLGIRQRLALGCALIHKPEILFLDEPTAGVDLVARRKFWNLIYALSREEKVTVLVTTHYMDEAEHCDRLGFIYNGRLVALGTSVALKEETSKRLGVPLYLDCAQPLRAWDLLRRPFPRNFHYGRRVRVLSTDPQEDIPLIQGLLDREGIPLHRLQEEEIRLEDAFIHYIELEEAREKGA
jgi:ABC-2 type transport system ATP-binding protein